MSTLFLDGIFTDGSESPSSVKITMPNRSSKSNVPAINLVGLMQGDVSFSAQNSWGTIVNDISNLADLASLSGSNNMFSWIGASTMCWKGTSPLSIGIEFFLINYKKGLQLEEQLKTLVKLAALDENVDATANSGSYTAQVHGGYAPDLFSDNTSLFFSLGEISSSKNLTNPIDNSKLYNSEGNAVGALQLAFGKKSVINNLLLSKINVTESIIEVSDQSGGTRKPLYYKVSAQFTGVRPLLTVDVDNMFRF